MVHHLGRGADLVGRSAECDFPKEVLALPVVMRATVEDGHRSSLEIDARVRASRVRNESLYTLDVPLLGRLHPEVILTQDLCGVCSVTGEEVASACRRAKVDPKIVSLSPHDLAEVRADLRTVARVLGIPEQGEAAEKALLARERTVREGARPHPPSRVAIVEWLDPPILAGLWAPEMVSVAGGRAVGGVEAGRPAVTTDWATLTELDPDLVILSPCSFSVARTLEELARSPRTPELLRFRPGSVWLADEAYFSRPGPRLWMGLELLADLLHHLTPRTPMPARLWEAPQVAG